MTLAELGFALESIPDRHDPTGETRLVLRDMQARQKQLPLAVDFLDEKLIYRITHGFGPGQPLGRALGLKKHASKTREEETSPVSSGEGASPLSVVDGTAGLGTDSFLMAALGCRVLAVERSPIVAALLKDGLRRLRAAIDRAENQGRLPLDLLRQIAGNLRVEEADAHFLLAGQVRPDVVFLDPMFPEEFRSQGALPKKSMQIFRRLIGPDLDADALLDLALGAARSRVVVKRPIGSEPIASRRPHATYEGKTARLDLYMVGV